MKLSKDEQDILNELHGIPKAMYPQITKLIHLIKFDFIYSEQHRLNSDTAKPKLKLSFKESQKVLSGLKSSLSEAVINERRESR